MEYPEKIKTEFGNASIMHKGYYRINTRKEGNHGKFLHTLILERKLGRKLLTDEVCHHIDGNKLNNHEDNLECMSKSKHDSLHNSGEDNYWFGKTGVNKGKKFSKETREKQSKTRIEKGVAKGEKNGRALVTERQVRSIKLLLRNLTHRGAVNEIAAVYGVKPGVIYKIKYGESWKHVNVDYPDKNVQIMEV
jgi:hypothetical protein